MTLRICLMASLLALCLATVCFAAVSVNNASSEVGPQVILTATTDAASPTYQWYECEEDGTIIKSIDGATDKEYKPYVDVAGETYYKVVVNGTEEAVATVTGTMPTEPIVFMFNNEADLERWNKRSNTDKEFANIDGKASFGYTPVNDGSTDFKNEDVNDFYIQGYPYVVISVNYPDYTSNTLDVYMATDRKFPDGPPYDYSFSSAYTGIQTVCNQGFNKLILNTTTAKYENYINGVKSTSGTANGDGIGGGNWKGKINHFRLDFSNKNEGKKCYIEYVGFFPTEKMALDYAGAMPLDSEAKPFTDALDKAVADGKFKMNFCEAETNDAVVANAKALVETLTADAAAALKQKYNTVEVSVANGAFSRPNAYAAGTYTFDARILIGDDPFHRSLVSKKIVMELEEKPQPLVVTFDSKDKISDKYMWGVKGTKTSFTFVEKGTTLDGQSTAEDRSFMRMTSSMDTSSDAPDVVQVYYNGFDDHTGNRFNYQDYPYMKISYRRNVPALTKKDGSGADTETMMIYTATNNPSYFIRRGTATTPVWEQLVVDMRKAKVTNAISFYADKAVTPSSYGTMTMGVEPQGKWDECTLSETEPPIKIRLSRYGREERTIDFEYIAFFASEEEARMYPKALPTNAEYDTDNLKQSNKFTADTGVVTKAQAEAAAEKYLSGFVFATKYNIDKENAVFTDPSSSAPGSYVFDVWFGGEKVEEYTVQVTMTIPQLAKPVIMYADTTTTMQSITSSNGKMKLEDGVIKLSVNNPAKEDGFWLVPTFPGSIPQFSVPSLPFLKVRYKMSGITKKTDGSAGDTSAIRCQFYFWMSDPAYSALGNTPSYREFRPYGGNFEDGDELEIIVDTSYITSANANSVVWVRNLTKGETTYRNVNVYSYRNEDGGTDKNYRVNANTKYKEMRLNFSRNADYDRYVEFAYAGFFASLDEAMKFNSDTETEARLQQAGAQLKAAAQTAVLEWGDVAMEKTEIPDSQASFNQDGTFDVAGVKTKSVTAIKGIRRWVVDQIGLDGNVTITDYTPATATTKGNVTFDITLESGYKSVKVEDITLTFGEKPEDYIMWRFNDPEILSKINILNPTVGKIEDNLLKLEHMDQYNGANFTISLDTADFNSPAFKLQNYSYMLLKYRRLYETSTLSFVFNTQEGTSGSTSRMGLGWYADQWYYSLLDANVRDKVTPWVYNYNMETNTLEKNYVDPKLGAPEAPDYRGSARTFTMQIGSFKHSKRGAEIEYIAFFPSMADARNYVENLEVFEDAVADTSMELKGYTADTVSYYDGNTKAIAEAKAKAVIEDKLSAPGVDVAISTVNYTAPVLDTTDGSYVFTATVTKGGKTVYTAENITFTISKEIDNSAVVYRFTNPDYIKTIAGAKAEYDYKAMKLINKTFTFETLAANPNVSEAYNVMALDATYTGSVTALINGTTTVNADDNGYFDISAVTDAIDTVEFTFEDADAQIVALGFFADDTAADAYDFDAVPAALTTAASKFTDTSYALENSKTLADVKVYTRQKLTHEKLKDTDAYVVDITYSDYIASTETKTGSVKITVKLAYGEKSATCYTDKVFNVTIPVDTDRVVATAPSKGHEFLGYDTITASKSFASAPMTLEFNIRVAKAQLSGDMNILKNGTVAVKLSNGKIVCGGVSSSTTLKADTWTHVAITSDGEIYINGTLDNSGNTISFKTDAPVIGEGFVGHLLDVRFWSDIRTEAEIKANMTNRTDSDALLANWMLNAANYKWLEYFDSSANENTATFKSTGWYKLEAGMQGDYSMIHFGDTQSYFANAPFSYNRLPEMFKWMADNKDKYNIGQLTLLGDATQTNTFFEWEVIRESFDFIEGKIPYTIPLGNHDYPSPSSGVGAEIRDTAKFRNAFPYDDYLKSYGPEGDNTFGGTFRGEKDLTNMYSLVTIGGVDYIFFSLEYGPRDEVLDWVGETLIKYPERQAVISTHCYFEMNGTLSFYNSTTNAQFSDGNEGIDIYNKIVTKYPNVILVTCGHSQGDDSKQQPHNRGSGYKDSPTSNDFGGDAVQILSDCSAYALNYPDGVNYGYGSKEANSVAFGADEGLIFMMMFEDGGKTMHTYVYSPLHDSFFRSVNEQTHTIKDIKAQPTLNVVGTELREADTELPMGMRFKMTLSKSYKNFAEPNKIEVKGYGMVLVPEDVVEEGVEVTADMFKGTNLENMVAVEECSDAMYYNDKNRTDFTVVVHSIPTPETDNGVAYSTEILARAYVDYTVNGGEVQRLYSYKTLTCSMNDLVNAD